MLAYIHVLDVSNACHLGFSIKTLLLLMLLELTSVANFVSIIYSCLHTFMFLIFPVRVTLGLVKRQYLLE